MRLSTALVVVAALFASPAMADAQPVQVTIDRIDENKSITGHVTGLSPSNLSHYRVVVYVHTDIWYIHPYAGQGQGQSWAAIDASGKWSIDTVRREFAADQVAALVVDANFTVPDRTPSVDGIQNVALSKKNLRGTDDYKKL